MNIRPKIKKAEICFVKVIGMPDFAIKSINVTSPFFFLNSLSGYSRYYLELESQMRTNQKTTSHVSIFGVPLKPINRYHSMHSYWKSFRLTVEKNLKNIPNWDIVNVTERDFIRLNKDSFFFLPLMLKLPIGRKKIDAKEFPVKLQVYLFPFGACCVQMRVLITNELLDIDEFVQLIDRLPTKLIIRDGLNFNDCALLIAREINQLIFGEKTNVKGFSPHAIVSIIQAEPDIEYREETHPLKKHIAEVILASCLAKKKYAEVDNLGQQFIDQTLSYKLKGVRSRPDQLLYFTTDRTLLYISPSWVNKLSSVNEKDKKLVKVKCMMYNYRSFFTLAFSVNRFFRECLPLYKDRIIQTKVQEIKTIFSKTFPGGKLTDSAFDYKGNLDGIADAVKFKHTLTILDGLANIDSATPGNR